MRLELTPAYQREHLQMVARLVSGFRYQMLSWLYHYGIVTATRANFIAEIASFTHNGESKVEVISIAKLWMVPGYEWYDMA